MTRDETRDEGPRGPVELRLRQALDARAAGITVRDLRPARPPGGEARRLPWAAARLRRFALPLAGLAAAAAAVVGYAVLAPDPGPLRREPVPPAAPPSRSPTGPAPSAVPVPPAPSPSPFPPSSSPAPSVSSPRPPLTPGSSPDPEAGVGAPKPSGAVSRPPGSSAAPSGPGQPPATPSASPSRS
ncbi:hypothetical protein SAVIM338S_06578 [Streptomyces avidinii]